jgi:hypothetical protein
MAEANSGDLDQYKSVLLKALAFGRPGAKAPATAWAAIVKTMENYRADISAVRAAHDKKRSKEKFDKIIRLLSRIQKEIKDLTEPESKWLRLVLEPSRKLLSRWNRL